MAECFSAVVSKEVELPQTGTVESRELKVVEDEWTRMISGTS